MSEKETIEEGVHPEAILLPWYANGTLSQSERQQIARHVDSCADCEHQLEEITGIRKQLITFYEGQPSPSRRQAQLILAKVAQEASARRSAPVTGQSWQDRVDGWIRTFFLPQWVPTLAASLIFVQFGLLLWLTLPHAPTDQITTRSLSSPTNTFKITFHEMATEKQIRELLSEVRGRIISGPGSDHVYLIEAIGGSEAITAKVLETLRAKSDVVHSAQVVSPEHTP
jgi:hypothetical protein